MTRNERRKQLKIWKAKEPFKYDLYKLMIQLYIDEDETRKYTKIEAIEFINTLTDDEAEDVIIKTKENEGNN